MRRFPMTRTIVLGCLFCVAVARATAAAAPAEASTQPAGDAIFTRGLDKDGTVHVVAHKAVTLTTGRAYKRVNIGGPDIASVDAVGPTQVLITGLKEGETNITIWDDANVSQTVDVRVSAPVGGSEPQKAPGKWDIAGDTPPLGPSKIPGFVRFNLSKA